MSPKLKTLSGKDLIRILEGFGFLIHKQKGSHVKLRKAGSRGEKQTLTIPLHKELDKGTLLAIFRQASRYIPREELQKAFYSP